MKRHELFNQGNDMQVEMLEIRREKYGASKGLLVGKVFFRDGFGAAVEIPLDDALSRKVLAVCADEVVQAGNAVAAMLVADVVDSVTAIEDQTG